MRKVMTALLAFLLIFSFASCEKDKSEDTIATYEKFITSERILFYAESLYETTGADVGEGVNAQIDKALIRDYILESLLEKLDAKYAKITTPTVESTTGNIKAVTSGTNTKITYENGVISFKYTPEGATEEVTDKLTLNGTIVREAVSSRGDSGMKYTYDLTINGKAYRLSYEYDGGKYTSAKVDGTDVDLTLLNARSKYL